MLDRNDVNGEPREGLAHFYLLHLHADIDLAVEGALEKLLEVQPRVGIEIGEDHPIAAVGAGIVKL